VFAFVSNDAPEKDQPYGKEARRVLKQYMPMVAKMKEYDEDRYGRLIVELFTEDNKSINAAMICSGAACNALRWTQTYGLVETLPHPIQ
jgi:endonuclease YncB( thermonuclease family)